jgi:hypothetical protein
MITLREAAQLAVTMLKTGMPEYARDVLEVLEAALEQSEQEPVAWMHPSGEGYDSAFRDHSTVIVCTGTKWEGWIPLYTHPPCREWRGLSKDESLKLWGMRSDGPSNLEIIGFARAIEAALKERNA